MRLLLDLRERFDVALILISHDVDLLLASADRVLVMYAGELIEEARVADLAATPCHPFTAALMRMRPSETRRGAALGRLPTIPGVGPGLPAQIAGCAFEPRCDERVAACATRHPRDTSFGETRRVRCLLHEQ
jgi:oligopeptide/dipeptide ABC transporter ATP-binding protein